MTGGDEGAFEALAILTFSTTLAISARNFVSSVWVPFKNVLQCRVNPAIATASPTSASLAPFTLANSVWA